MLIRNPQRRGVTLLELLVVVTLLGIVSSIVMMRFGRTLLSEFGANSEAREISLALLACQRSAIRTGDNHFVQFDGTTATSFQIRRREGGSSVLVNGPTALSDDVKVTASSTTMEFTFEGQALAPYSVTVEGEKRSWLMTVVPISGAIQVSETTP